MSDDFQAELLPSPPCSDRGPVIMTELGASDIHIGDHATGGKLVLRGASGGAPGVDGVIDIEAPHGKLLARIYPDGIIEFGESYTPDGAARAFWSAIGALRPLVGGNEQLAEG